MQFDEVPEGFCEECHIPLAPDPKPDTLFIYLHAWRYTTERLGCWETPMWVFCRMLFPMDTDMSLSRVLGQSGRM